MPEYRDADHLGESMMQYFERYSKWRDKMMADNMNPDGTPKLNIPVAPKFVPSEMSMTEYMEAWSFYRKSKDYEQFIRQWNKQQRISFVLDI